MPNPLAYQSVTCGSLGNFLSFIINPKHYRLSWTDSLHVSEPQVKVALKVTGEKTEDYDCIPIMVQDIFTGASQTFLQPGSDYKLNWLGLNLGISSFH